MNKWMLVFTECDAHWEKHPKKIEELMGKEHTVFAPDLSAVEMVASKYWKLVDGKVLPMNLEERRARDLRRAKINVLGDKPLPGTWSKEALADAKLSKEAPRTVKLKCAVIKGLPWLGLGLFIGWAAHFLF